MPKKFTRLALLLATPLLLWQPVALAANLLSAAQNGDLAAIEALQRAGASLDQQDANGNTALMFALRNQHPELAYWLLEHGANPRLARTGADEMQHWRALDFAIVNGYPALALTLISAGAAVNYRDRDGDTPLHHAVRAGQRQVVEALLAAGADLDAQRDLSTSDLQPGWTALMYAIYQNNQDLALYLLRQGANPYLISGATSDSIERGEENAFMLAWRASDKNFSRSMLRSQVELIAGLPLDSGPAPQARRKDLIEHTLFFALLEAEPDVVLAMIKAGGNLNGDPPALVTATDKQARLDFIRQLVSWGANPNLADSEGALPLHLAIKAERVDLVSYFLQFRPDINARYLNHYQQTPLMLAACGPPEILRQLLAQKPNLELGDSSAYPALLIAVDCQHHENVAQLLKAGASWRIKSENDNSPLALALATGDPPLVQLLLKAGARSGDALERKRLVDQAWLRFAAAESEAEKQEWKAIVSRL